MLEMLVEAFVFVLGRTADIGIRISIFTFLKRLAFFEWSLRRLQLRIILSPTFRVFCQPTTAKPGLTLTPLFFAT